MKLSQICLLGLIFLLHTNSASSDVTSQYLNQALQSSSYQFEPVSANSSWLDQTELRYSGSDQDEHGLAFRFRPRFASQRSAENRIVNLLNRQQTSVLNAQINDELKLRYNKLIELIESYNEVNYLEHKLDLDQQRLVLIRSLAETESFRIAELQSSEFEYNSDQQQLTRIARRLNIKLQSFAGIPPAQLRNFLSTWSQQVSDWDRFVDSGSTLIQLVDTNQLDDAVDRVDYQLAQQKLRLARSNSASWLEFVELKLVDRSAGEQEASLGISIPLGTNNFGISQRAANVNRRNLSLQAIRREILRSISDSVEALGWLRDQAEILKSGEALLKQQFKKLRNIGQPAIVLKLTSDISRYQNELRRLHIRGLRAYIELLHTAGYLAKEPRTNWLLRSQPKL